MGVQELPDASESTSSEMMTEVLQMQSGKPTLRVAEGTTAISCVEPSSSIVAGYQYVVLEREARELQSRSQFNIYFVVTRIRILTLNIRKYEY